MTKRKMIFVFPRVLVMAPLLLIARVFGCIAKISEDAFDFVDEYLR